MGVKRVEYKRKRAGTVLDEKTGQYVGFQIDIRINGKRHRNRIFPTRCEAESFIDEIKRKMKKRKPEMSDEKLIELFIGVREKTIGYVEFKKAVRSFQTL